MGMAGRGRLPPGLCFPGTRREAIKGASAKRHSMVQHTGPRLIAGAALILAAAIAPICAQGQTSVPDLSGLWQRVAVKGEVTFDPIPGAKDGVPIERVWTPGPDTEEIVSGKYDNPILQPWAREIVKAKTEQEIKLVHVYEADDLCWPVGVPQIINLRENVRFIQTKGQVTIVYQRDHLVRRVYMNQKHSAKAKPDVYGESVGRYEGDTLVIDTIGFNPHKMMVLDNYGTPYPHKLHGEERYRGINDEKGKGLEARFRVEDPGTFTMPWSGRGIYRPSRDTDMSEVVCAENQREFDDSSTLHGIPQANTPPF